MKRSVLLLAASAACLSQAGASPPAPKVDRIVIDKAEHRLTLLQGRQVVAVYTVALGRGGLAPKVAQGDGRVPEGVYRITERKADSQYYRALRIGYPTKAQAEAALARGIDPGSDIMIHGLPNGMGWIGQWHRLRDWTAGCIAVTNAEMDAVWSLVPVGTVVEIRAKAAP
jgi:murein L,D-transpeptidase YafK